MQDIQPLYSWIVDSVVAKARTSFLQEGVDECAPAIRLPALQAQLNIQGWDLFGN
jgi:hypothetical protein